MATSYQYKARDRTGQVITGNVVADDPPAAAAFLRDKGYFVTFLALERETFQLEQLVQGFQTVSAKDLAVFCRQFSTMMDAGVPLVSSLSVLVEQTQKPVFKDALQGIYKKVQEGQSVAAAMEDYRRIFPQVMVSMIHAGEIGGVLDEVLARLAVHFEKEHKMTEKVKSALTYPAVVVVMAILAVSFILVFVLPTFMKLFAGMKMQLPLPTRILVGVSNILRNYWFLFIGVLVATVVGWRIAYKRREFRLVIDQIILGIPIFGSLWQKIAIARFSRMLSTLMRSGVPIISALEVVKKTTGNTIMEDTLDAAQRSVSEGSRLAATFASSKAFTPMLVQMVAIGEESGQIDKMLEKVADFYEGEVEEMVGRLGSIIEPIMVGVLGVIIGMIVISIALPLFDIVTNVGGVR